MVLLHTRSRISQKLNALVNYSDELQTPYIVLRKVMGEKHRGQLQC